MDRAEALAIRAERGTAAAAREAGVSASTIKRWASEAGEMNQPGAEKTSEARAAAARKVAQTWGDFREQEALAAGTAANRVRRELIDRTNAGVAGRDLQAVAVAYGILVDKAEKLSGQATARIELWAESELDVELRKLIAEMEDKAREGS